MILICTKIPVNINIRYPWLNYMYICVCNAVTQQEILQAISDGAESLAQLREELKVASCCGMCVESVQECLQAPVLAE